MNGVKICTKATCKMCKNTLSARFSAGTGHLKRHQKSCKQKTDQAARVQSRLACNPDGFVYNCLSCIFCFVGFGHLELSSVLICECEI